MEWRPTIKCIVFSKEAAHKHINQPNTHEKDQDGWEVPEKYLLTKRLDAGEKERALRKKTVTIVLHYAIVLCHYRDALDNKLYLQDVKWTCLSRTKVTSLIEYVRVKIKSKNDRSCWIDILQLEYLPVISQYDVFFMQPCTFFEQFVLHSYAHNYGWNRP